MQGSPIPPTSLTPAQIAAAGGLLATNNLSDVAAAATSRTNLGLGSAATQAIAAFDPAGAAAAVLATSLQKASNLSDVATPATALANLSGFPLHLTINAQTGTTYTLVIGDDGKLVTLSNALAITLTVPTNAAVPFAVGAQILLLQIGAGQVTVAGAGGVTVNASPGLKIAGQERSAGLMKLATNTWELVGALSA